MNMNRSFSVSQEGRKEASKCLHILVLTGILFAVIVIYPWPPYRACSGLHVPSLSITNRPIDDNGAGQMKMGPWYISKEIRALNKYDAHIQIFNTHTYICMYHRISVCHLYEFLLERTYLRLNGKTKIK